MNTMLISIIVPVYNAEKYLEKCISSIIVQTHYNLEIILINDGSDDGSLKMCQKFMKKDTRVKIYNQMNSGVSSARNLGLKHVSGDYLMFVDSDDYLLPNTVEVYMDLIKEYSSDLIVSAWYELEPNHELKTMNLGENKDISLYDELEFQVKMLDCAKHHFMNIPWNKLFKTDIIKNQKIKFEEGLSLSEDTIFNFQFAKYVQKVVLVDKPLYVYRNLVANSLSHKANNYNNKWEIRLHVFEKFKEYFHEKDIYGEYTGEIYKLLIYYYRLLVEDIVNINNNNFFEKCGIIKKYIVDVNIKDVLFNCKIYDINSFVLLLFSKCKCSIGIVLFYTLKKRSIKSLPQIYKAMHKINKYLNNRA